MRKEQIQAIGNFLQYYSTDLNYIKNFQDFKKNKISSADYVGKDEGTFYSFLIEFRVVRNFTKGATDKLLEETRKWIFGKNPNNVDLFAEKLANSDLTRGNKTTSLASKVLFLNDPWTILPLDNNTRAAFKQIDNTYSHYISNLEKYSKTHSSVIAESMKYIKPLAEIIEQDFTGKIKDLHIIRENRIIDKLLWSSR
jgi:hypothetical protein